MSQASKRRQSSSEDEGGGANWMDTYGDLVTLLLCFFVLLYSFSSIDSAKWEALVGAFKGESVTVITPLNPTTAVEDPLPELKRTSSQPHSMLTEEEVVRMMKELEDFEELVNNVNEYVEGNSMNVVTTADYDLYEITISFPDYVLFDSGQADLREDMLGTMDHMINLLSGNINLISRINIEGHTDDVPIRNAQFTDNWDLSIARASTIFRYILASDAVEDSIIGKNKFFYGGYGEYHPIDTNETDAGRAKNRRVDFVVKAYKTI